MMRKNGVDFGYSVIFFIFCFCLNSSVKETDIRDFDFEIFEYWIGNDDGRWRKGRQ